MSSEAELLPCPFCGGTDHFIFPPSCTEDAPYNPADRASPLVRCRACYAEVPGKNWDHSCKTAIAAWNRRSASPSIGRVGVKALEWQGDKAETPFGPYTVIRTPDGYQSRFQRDEVAHVGFNAVDMFYGARRAAQDHAQADYESRIRSTLVYHEEPAGDTQGAGWVNQVQPKQKCPACQGTGDIGGNPSYGLCPDCGGSGKVSAALVSPPDNGGAIAALLDAYDAETKNLPLGHEMPTRGASTYNADQTERRQVQGLEMAAHRGQLTPAPSIGDDT